VRQHFWWKTSRKLRRYTPSDSLLVTNGFFSSRYSSITVCEVLLPPPMVQTVWSKQLIDFVANDLKTMIFCGQEIFGNVRKHLSLVATESPGKFYVRDGVFFFYFAVQVNLNNCKLRFILKYVRKGRHFHQILFSFGSARERLNTVLFKPCGHPGKSTKRLYEVPAVSKVLIAPIFWNLRNFETERDTSENYGIKSLDLYEIYQF